MRVAGAVLLIGGCLLCVWIVWAAVGFLMMGFGLICLQIAERNKARAVRLTPAHFDEIDHQSGPRLIPEQKRLPSAGSAAFRYDRAEREPQLIPRRNGAPPARVKAARPDRIERRQEPYPPAEPEPFLVLPERETDRQQNAIDPYPHDEEADPQREPRIRPRQQSPPPAGSTDARPDRIERTQEPSAPAEPEPSVVTPEREIDRQQTAIDPYPYDKEKWRSLVENDADISRAAEVLARFGEEYVSEFAMSYLVLNDKAYLPIILRKIAAAIRGESRGDVATAAAMESHPDTDPIGSAPGRTRSLSAGRAVDQRADHDARTEKPAPASDMPQARLDLIRKPAVVQSAAEISAVQPEQRASNTGLSGHEREVEASDARWDVRAAAIAHATTQAPAPGVDDAQNLAELLSRLIRKVP
jgi:hypothetical protein